MEMKVSLAVIPEEGQGLILSAFPLAPAPGVAKVWVCRLGELS